MKVIAVIPARSGSKRVPGKNVKPLAGQPLIGHTIKTAIQASCFDRVITSTDTEEIANIASQFGSELPPKLRSDKFATDDASVLDVVMEILGWMDSEHYAVDAVMLLQPTSPFRRVETIHKAIDLFKEVAPESVVSVCPAYHSSWYKKIDQYGVMSPYESESMEMPQHALPVYRLNGAIYLSHISTLNKHKSFYSPHTRALVMENLEESVDIDTMFDWKMAEFFSSRV